jgi:hypothetical protein
MDVVHNITATLSVATTQPNRHAAPDHGESDSAGPPQSKPTSKPTAGGAQAGHPTTHPTPPPTSPHTTSIQSEQVVARMGHSLSCADR